MPSECECVISKGKVRGKGKTTFAPYFLFSRLPIVFNPLLFTLANYV